MVAHRTSSELRGWRLCPRARDRLVVCSRASRGLREPDLVSWSDLAAARTFYVDALGLSLLVEDEIVVVVGGSSGRVVLHRNDRVHDERGIFPAGSAVGGAAVWFTVEDPDECERDAVAKGLTVMWANSGSGLGTLPCARRSRRAVRGARENASVTPR